MVHTKTASDPRKAALWRRRLAEQAASGLGISPWCRQSGVSDSLFHYWKRALAQRDARRRAPRNQAVAASEAHKDREAVFAPVVIAAPVHRPRPAAPVHRPHPAAPLSRPHPAAPIPKPHPAASVAAWTIEIELSGRRLVRVGAGFDAATLARVLAVLEGRGC
jgi:hypothetical protein